jgi:hypothetical protein
MARRCVTGNLLHGRLRSLYRTSTFFGGVIRFVLLHQFEIHEREDCPSLPRPRSPLVSIEPQKVTRRLLHGSRFVPLSDAIPVIKSSLLLPDFLRTELTPLFLKKLLKVRRKGFFDF